MIKLLTATGCRPKAWAICELLMSRQDYQGAVEWIVVDDGPVAQPVNFQRKNWHVKVSRPTPFWKRGQNTQARNLAAGVQFVKEGEVVLIIEDDDHYAPDYISKMVEALESAELVGVKPSRYYNVATKRSQTMMNNAHSSLCSTAMRGKATEEFRKIVNGLAVKFIDIQLWKACSESRLIKEPRLCTGIKGLPGRGGIGTGHRSGFGREGTALQDWIGEDAALYES